MPAGFRSINYHKLQENYIPCGKNKNNSLQLFKRTLEDIGATARVLLPPYQQQQIYIPSEWFVDHARSSSALILENEKGHFLQISEEKYRSIFYNNPLVSAEAVQ
ncbi:hypothetical protein OIU79_023804 [Salix purpurea]|uniref:Uncharacterized protein n=1 Tax=Salix purpurea TaxID=77065 RepID=A0A9Q0WCH7_SALPP|nr:hypothetical protein OIU79_023804 [Salix purpurea]